MDNREARNLITFISRELKASGDGTNMVLGHLLSAQAADVAGLVERFFNEPDVPGSEDPLEVNPDELDENGARG